jgi:2-iminobutanoate/2-iminopropanoate deaminase
MSMTRRSLASSAAVIGAAAFTPFARAAAAMKKRVLAYNPNATPKPPYSPAVAYGNLLFVSGKASYGASDPKDIRVCTKYALGEIEKELKNAGSSMDKVLKVQVFLRSIDDYAAMNEVFAATFVNEPPARTTVAAIIPRESLVEIEAVAYI